MGSAGRHADSVIADSFPRLAVAGLALSLIAGFATGAPAAGRAVPSGATPLRALVGRASAVVVARPGPAEELDEGRLAVHPLRVEEVLRGDLAIDVAPVVEIRGTSARPAYFTDVERAVVLLRPAAPLSYYAEHLPEGPRFEPAGGRDGIIPIRTEADLDATRALLEQGAAAAALPPGDEQQAALRALAFAAVDARHPRWLADALLELRSVPASAELSTEEVSTLAGALRDTTMPAPLRARLLHLLAERHWVGAADAVAAAAVDEPALLDAILDARARLGIPAGRKELAPYLASGDPRLRAAAVRALAALDDPEALAEVGRHATGDADTGVRTAAIAALAGTGRDAAVPYVQRAFDDPAPAIRQASARALLALGGRRKSEALADLALSADTPEARQYAAVVLLISTPPDDPALARLRAKATDPMVRRVLEHGIELHLDRHGE